jgi:hypothetical protein
LGIVFALPTATGDAVPLPIRWPYLFYRLDDRALRRHIYPSYPSTITHNKIKNKYRACGVVACKQERERKKQVKLLQKAKEFVLLKLLKPILDLELSIAKANIELQLRRRLISNLAPLGLDMNSILRHMQTVGSATNGRVRDINSMAKDDSFTMQEDYISFLGLDNRDYLE